MPRLYPLAAEPKPPSVFSRRVWRPRGYHRESDPLTVPESPMSDLQQRFEQAQNDVKQLAERPSNMTLLRLYALYKQGSEGDVHGDKPGMADFVGRNKFEAWETQKGTSQEEAMQKYIELVEELKSGAAS
jgi:acyl-CoA-binding protein